jgi:H/ACA ribonucleoprotein complex subunit 1
LASKKTLFTPSARYAANTLQMNRGGSRGFGRAGGGMSFVYLNSQSSLSGIVTGRGGGRGGFQQRDMGPPDQVLGGSFHSLIRYVITENSNALEMGSFVHAVEDEMLCSSLMMDKVPYFNAPIYLQNKSVIGKVDEILGPINEVFFSVKMGDGMIASSFKKGDKVYIGGDKLLPIERFLPKPKVAGGKFHYPTSSL